MNNSYNSYVNYIENTSYNNDLSSALVKIKIISDNIDSLINALGKNNGPNITLAVNDLESFQAKLNKISNYYNSLKNSLKYNANAFDKTLSWVKSRYDNRYSTLYSFDGNFVNNPIVWFHLFSNLNIYGNTYKAVKTLQIDKVEISESTGYIMHVWNIESIVYTLKPKNVIQSFDISTGTPKDIIVNTESHTYQFADYYVKNNQKVNLMD